MRLVDTDLVKMWNDGSINKRAKGELMLKFHRQLGYTDTSNTFGELIRGQVSPTPDQLTLMRTLITEYWNFYNPKHVQAA